MKFKELTIQEYENFATQCVGRFYLNSSKMIELKKNNGWETYYVGVVDDEDHVLAAAGFSKVPVMRFYHYAYAQRGILCDFNDHALTTFFTEKLKKYIASHDMAYMRMDPYVEYQQLDEDGQVVKDGWNNQAMIDFLASIGYEHQGFFKGWPEDRQVRYMVVMDLDDLSEEDIVANYEPNTRRTIVRAKKMGVKTKELDLNHLEPFMELMDYTAKKRNFTDMGLEAYQNQMRALGSDHAKVIVSYLDTAEVHEKNTKDLADIQKEQEKTNAILAKNPNSKKMNRRKKEELERIAQIERWEKTTNELEAKYGKEIILSGAYFVIYDGEMDYISSGSYDELRKYSGPYVIQDQAILTAKRLGLHRYNFTGTSGIFNEDGPDYGVFLFKKHLGGRPIELMGDFDLVCDPKMMKKIHRMQSVTHILRK